MMTHEELLKQLKIQLKKWEVNFVKENCRKPTKQDIASNKEIENVYSKYYKLKNPPNSKAEINTSCKVWSSNLLKANSKSSDFDDAFENVTPSQTKETMPTQTYRDKIKQNISQSCIKSVRMNLKKETRNKRSEDFYQSMPIVDVEDSDVAVSNNHNSPTETLAMGKNYQYRICKKSTMKSYARGIQRTPLGLVTKIRNSFIDKNVNPAWFNETDDLPNKTISKSNDYAKLAEIEPIASDHIKLKQNPNVEISEHAFPNAIRATDEFGTENSLFRRRNDKNNENSPARISKNSNVSLHLKDEDDKLIHDLAIGCDNVTSEVCNSPIKKVNENLNVFAIKDLHTSNLPKTDLACKEFASSIEEKTSTSKTVDDKRGDEKKLQKTSEKAGFCTRSVVSTNYVRVNIQRKVYLRKAGRGKFLRKKIVREKLAKKGILSRSKWRRSQTNNNAKRKSDNACFRCGQIGHWANKCTQILNTKIQEQPNNFVLQDEEHEETGSLEEILSQHQFSSDDLPSTIEIGCHTVHHCEPLYDFDTYADDEVVAVLKQFGFTNFRSGQKKAIKRILCGKPTLLVLSTGMGKSLCYQLPAYMYSLKRKSITLVISPLVSLMDDQITGLPNFLKAVCLHSGMTKEQRDKIMREIEERKVDILLVSPEAITSWAGMSPFSSPFSKLPPVSFVCIDECHCLSEWSHNFRPSYLRVCQVLRENLGIKCLVGLTATSTLTACNSIARQLGINDHVEGIIKETNVPDNIRLSVSRDEYRDEALQELLTSEPFCSLPAIIVYCTRRDEAARLASFLRTTLQYQLGETEPIPLSGPVTEEPHSNSKTKKRKRTSHPESRKRKALAWDVDCYHAGMSPAERRRVQKRFMTGQLRVVVATVAFGMGIDKQNVRAVVHYNMPRSFERYVQETGRAGRDGLPAFCHTFLNCQGADLSELSRHIYTKTVDRYVIKQLVKKVFSACRCSALESACTGHLTSIPIDATIEELDLTREGIETLLCYMELDGLIRVYLPTQAVCLVRCYDGPRQMMRVAKKCPAVALGLANKGTQTKLKNELDFSVVEVANRLGMNIVNLKLNLRGLMWDTTLSENPTSGRSGVTVEFDGLSFLLKTLREASDEFLDDVTSSLHSRVLQQEKKELAQLQTCFNTLRKHSVSNVASMKNDTLESKSKCLKAVINEYFTKSEEVLPAYEVICPIESSVEAELRSSIRQFLCVHSADLGYKLTGRAIARIFHGIESPRYPATTWGTARRFWRSRLSVDFNSIVKISTEELLKFR